MTARSSWKDFERRCAARLGARRRPVTGVDRHDGDCWNAMFEYQVKLRRGQPAYLRDWLDGIVATAKLRNRIGIVIWKMPGQGKPDDDAVVCLKLSDWIELHGRIESDTL
jgi:hypothetical protein